MSVCEQYSECANCAYCKQNYSTHGDKRYKDFNQGLFRERIVSFKDIKDITLIQFENQRDITSIGDALHLFTAAYWSKCPRHSPKYFMVQVNYRETLTPVQPNKKLNTFVYRIPRECDLIGKIWITAPVFNFGCIVRVRDVVGGSYYYNGFVLPGQPIIFNESYYISLLKNDLYFEITPVPRMVDSPDITDLPEISVRIEKVYCSEEMRQEIICGVPPNV